MSVLLLSRSSRLRNASRLSPGEGGPLDFLKERSGDSRWRDDVDTDGVDRCVVLDLERVEARSPRVLRSDEDASRVILLALPEGDRLDDHQIHEHALVVVVEGRLLVRAGDQEREVSAPGLVHFAPAERHEVMAVSDCRILICLAPWPGVGHPSRSAG